MSRATSERRDLFVGIEGIVSGAERRDAGSSHRHGSTAVLALVGIPTIQEHDRRRTRSVTASSGGEDLPNNSYMRDQRELGENTVGVARPRTSATPDTRSEGPQAAYARTGEGATLKVEDKRYKHPNKGRHATKRLHDGLTLEPTIDNFLPTEKWTGGKPAERTRLNPAPFAAAAGLAAIVAPIATKVNWVEYLAAVALADLAGLVGLIPVHRALAKAREIPPSLIFLAAVACMRSSAGGANSGIAVVALLPVFWTALYGDRRQLCVVTVGMAVFFLAPLVLIGGPAYPATQYRAAVLNTGS